MGKLCIGDHVRENGATGKIVAFRPQNMVDVIFEGRDYAIRRPARNLSAVKTNPSPSKGPVFLAAVLTPESKRALYRWWTTLPLAPEPLPVSKSSHMTIKFKPSSSDVDAAPIGSEVTLWVEGWAANGKIQAVSVTCSEAPSTKKHPHVTFAVKDPSVAPALSDTLFDDPTAKKQKVSGPLLKARVGWSDGVNYHFEPPVRSNPGPRGGLTPSERQSLRSEAFALPGRRWPINDRNHAVIALQYMLRGFGNESDYPKILAAIEARYPRADGRNAEIWAFYNKHFVKQMRQAANPRNDVYEPEKEQFRAVVQGVYESQVRRHLGLKSTARFSDSSGARLDDQLPAEDKRRLLSSAYAIATRQGQKHGWLMPGSQTPTEKGRTHAMMRLSSSQAEHATENRQDYERTLAGVRKGSYYRVVAESLTINGRPVTHYIVQPRPSDNKLIPEYRLTEAAAWADAAKAENELYTKKSDSGSVSRSLMSARRNPRKIVRIKTDEDYAAEDETQLEQNIMHFQSLSVDEAENQLVKRASIIREFEVILNQKAVNAGDDWAKRNEDPLRYQGRALDALKQLLASRNDLEFTDVEQIFSQFGPIKVLKPSTTIPVQKLMAETLEKYNIFVPAVAWKAYADAAAQDLYRMATEGGKTGGIAGSNKNRADASGPRKAYEAALKNLNSHLSMTSAPPDIKQAQSTIKTWQDYGDYLIQDYNNKHGTHMPGPFEFDDGYMQTTYTPAALNNAVTEIMNSSSVVTQKTIGQVYAIERAAAEREARKARMSQVEDYTKPFYDVEKVILEPVTVYGKNEKQYKTYRTHVMERDESESHAMTRLKISPNADVKYEIRYVLYIPNKPRYVGKLAYAGGTQVLSKSVLERGVAKAKDRGLRLDEAPEQTKRSPRRVSGYESTGIQEGLGEKVYLSSVLKKFFWVSRSGVGSTEMDDELRAMSDESYKKRLEYESARDAMSAFLRGQKPTPKVPHTKRQFNSPSDNWVRYNTALSTFRRLRSGVFNELTQEKEGAVRDASSVDIYYTLSPELAYITILYFNNPAMMPAVKVISRSMEAVVLDLKGNVVFGKSTQEIETAPGEVYVPEITSRVRDSSIQSTPLHKRINLSVSDQLFNMTPLARYFREGLVVTTKLQTAERVKQEKEKLLPTIKPAIQDAPVQAQKHREALKTMVMEFDIFDEPDDEKTPSETKSNPRPFSVTANRRAK